MLKEYEITNGNRIFYGERVFINEKNIVFGRYGTGAYAHNNIVVLEDNLNLGNSVIEFKGENSIVFIRSSVFTYRIKIIVFNNSAVYIGKNNFINHLAGIPMNILAAEEMNIFMGDGGFMSLGIWLRNADGHVIYSMDTFERQNPARGVFIGDHVWLGQNATLLKGTQIGSGSIVGADAVVSGKKIPSNTAWGGNPARQLKERVFWTGQNVGTWTKREKEANQKLETDKFNYERDADSLSFDELDGRLSALGTADEKMRYLIELSKNQSKNRFAI